MAILLRSGDYILLQVLCGPKKHHIQKKLRLFSGLGIRHSKCWKVIIAI